MKYAHALMVCLLCMLMENDSQWSGSVQRKGDFSDMPADLQSKVLWFTMRPRIWSTTKRVSAFFHLHHKEARDEFEVHIDGKLRAFCSDPEYLEVTLDTTLTYRPHTESLRLKVTSRVLHPFDLAVHTSVSLFYPSTTHCEVWLDASVLHHRTIIRPWQASNLLKFAAKRAELRLLHAALLSLDTCSTPHSPVHRIWSMGSFNRDIHLCLPRKNCSIPWTATLHTGRITCGTGSGGKK